MGQTISNARNPFSRSRRQQNSTNTATTFDSIFSNRPVSLAYVRNRTNSRAGSQARRRSVLRRAPDRSFSRRTQTGHQTRRFSIFLSRPVRAPLGRSTEQSRTRLTATSNDVLDEDFSNEAASHFCGVCSEHVLTDLDTHDQHALNHRQDNDYWSIERARIPWCAFCQIYFQSQASYREHIMSVMRHNRRFAEAERAGAPGTMRVSRTAFPATPVLLNFTVPVLAPQPLLSPELRPLALIEYPSNIPGLLDIGQSPCLLCNRVFYTDDELREHQRTCNTMGVYVPSLMSASPEQDIPPLPPTRSNSIFSYESGQSDPPPSIRPSFRSRASYYRPAIRSRSRSRTRTISTWNSRRSDSFPIVPTSLDESSSSEPPRVDSRRPSFEEWLESTFRGSPPASLRTDVESTVGSSGRSSFLSVSARRARRVMAIYRRNSAISRGDSEEDMEKTTLPTKQFAYPCSICMGEDEELSALACGHVFGSTCLAKAIRSKKECPLCRKPASKHEIRRIYLT